MPRAKPVLKIVPGNGTTDNPLFETIKGRDKAFTLRLSRGTGWHERNVRGISGIAEAIDGEWFITRGLGQVEASVFVADDVEAAQGTINRIKGLNLRACVAWYADHAVLIVRHTPIHGDALEAFASAFANRVLNTGETYEVWEPVTHNRKERIDERTAIDTFDGSEVVDAVSTMRVWDVKTPEQSEPDRPKTDAEKEEDFAAQLAGWLEQEQQQLAQMPTWIIEGMIAEGAVGLISARKSNLKTFVAHGMAKAIATGTPFNDLPVQSGGVMYLAAENPAGVAMRHRAWLVQHGEDVPHFVVSGLRFPLGNRASAVSAAKAMASLPQFKEQPLKLLVLDTVGSTMAGQKINDEAFNNDKDTIVNAIYAHARAAAAAIGCAVLLVHHDGKDERKGTRGSSAWEDDADFVFKTKKTGSGANTVVTLTHTKSKNGEELPDRNFPMELIDLDPADVEALERARAKTGNVPDRHGKNNAAAYRVETGDKTLSMRLIATLASGSTTTSGQTAETTKSKLAKNSIITLLTVNGSMRQTNIVEKMGSQASEKTIRQYLKELLAEGRLTKEGHEFSVADPVENDD